MQKHVRVRELQLVIRRERRLDDVAAPLYALAEFAFAEVHERDSALELELQRVACRPRRKVRCHLEPTAVPVDRFLVATQLSKERRFLEDELRRLR